MTDKQIDVERGKITLENCNEISLQILDKEDCNEMQGAPLPQSASG